MLDENIPGSVAEELMKLGHQAGLIRSHLFEEAGDLAVARISESRDAVLISFDRDFQSIAPRIPDGQKRRFRKLSRIWLRCSEYQAPQRLRKAMSFIEAEQEIALNSRDRRMLLEIGSSYIRSNR
ncbi:MAG: hypothetical protein GVY13_19355 [Alphaproteobacteria bacterium]|nr:hypothetical protein [Alphaproteobacteria bacterium]